MARFSERTRFEVGDEVSNGTDTGVIELSYPRQSDGKQWPLVRITSGARTGQREWPGTKWLPLLDYQPKTNRFRCGECDREYWAPSSRGWCRQCVGKDEVAHAHRVTGSRTFARLGAAPRFQPAPEQVNATEKQRAVIERGRTSDDDSPF